MKDQKARFFEEWKDVPEFEESYKISNYGSVYSLLTKISLKPTFEKTGYLTVTLRKNGKGVKYLIHRLVAFSFVDGYSEGLFVNHKNAIKSDNTYLNLEWVTHSENIQHAYDNGLISRNTGLKNNLSKYSDQQIKDVQLLINNGKTNIVISKITGMNKVTISSIRNKTTLRYQS